MKKVYAICDKYGVVNIRTYDRNGEVCTSVMLCVYAEKKKAESKCKCLNELYGEGDMYHVEEKNYTDIF